MDTCLQTPNKKLSKTPKKDELPNKNSDGSKSFGFKNINLFSKFKISAFGNKKASTENKEVEVINSKTTPTAESDPKPTQTHCNGTTMGPCIVETSPDASQSKALPNGKVCDAKLFGHSAPNEKKHFAHPKHAMSAGRVNIQELIKTPRAPKKDVVETKNNAKVSKEDVPKNSNCCTDKRHSVSAPVVNPPDNSNLNGAIPHHNIPNLNNITNNIETNTNNFASNSNGEHNKDGEDAAVLSDCSVNSASSKDDNANGESAVETTEDEMDITSEPEQDPTKTNGTVTPMDMTGVVFYKAKCLLQDPASMGSKEKVKVDESEPSFYEEAPFERRDVTVKSDRWVTDLYTVDSLLGKGKFGEVKKCQERDTGRQLAAKFIEVNGPQDRNDVLNELEIMKNLQHPRLLQLYDAFEIRDKFCLVMELVNGGELFERVINDDFILTEKACVMFTRQICDGIAFMHTQNILHLDMKPENILCLTREGNRIKIIDFGLARKYNPKDDLRVLFGTPEFVAPEVVNFDPIAPATDMWSIGVVCYVLLSGLSPFMGESEQETLSNVTLAQWDFSAEEFDSISSEAKDFISKLLVKDPRKRMKSSECLEHQWLRRSVKREGHLPERSLSKKRLRKFVYRRKWQKAINAMLALKRMGVTLS
ncbi:hypothetical protein EGW08_002244 [Elysia chlorotica]|uniref:Protein kinase domain-containing protein n=1 Tax=Elysia chlorotica TaxID=188477 RepID=A0A433U843_ELYCH|nr:hypothetical protein EGW08_002244 [Elysia chlorotica]